MQTPVMPIEDWVQYIAMAVAVLALLAKRRGMKPYIPVALFAHFYAEVVCLLAMYTEWWTYPSRIITKSNMSIPANFVVIPVIAMFWIRYCPDRPGAVLLWNLLWSLPLTALEYWAERNTELIRYHGGYEWYHTLLLWLITFPIWLAFHRWQCRPKNRL